MTSRIKHFRIVFAEVVRYTFQPAIGFVLSLIALLALLIVAMLTYRTQPFVAVVFFCYSGFLVMVTVVGSYRYVRYRRFYKSVFR